MPREIAGGFQLGERLAEVDDMNAVAGIEDERLHLGVPAFRLVSKMDAGIQQFLNSDTNHRFPLVKSSPLGRTIPRNTGLISVLLWPPAPTGARHLRPLIPSGLAAQFSA
jgi:hypothetical protein